MRQALQAAFVLMMIAALSGCALFVEDEVASDLVCIPKEKAAELNLIDDGGTGEAEPAVDEEAAAKKEEETDEEIDRTEKPTEIPPGIDRREFIEGELVSLKPKATDPDGDRITFTFSEPLDKDGQWQTKAGDTGEYLVTVTASDGKSEVEKQLLIVVSKPNRPPRITGVASFEVGIGETVKLEPKVSDPDGDEVSVKYSGWMKSDTYTTKPGDEGTHTVTITADDGENQVRQDVVINVVKKNSPPVISEVKPISVKEGDAVKVTPSATDADNDGIEFTFGEPLDDEGQWQTREGDEGTYLATVTASDGELEDSAIVTITVTKANSPPKIELEDASYTVQEGESLTVKIEPLVTDADGDDVTLRYSGWMTSDTKTITDAKQENEGDFEVSVSASDGKDTTTVTVTVSIDVNAPPEFTF